MRITSDNNNQSILTELGQRIKRNRIDMQLTQSDLAKKSGVAVRTISTMESGRDFRIESLIRVLRVMGYADNLELLLPELAFNPEDYRTLGKERQRVSKKNTASNTESQWKWGDEE